MRKFIFYWVCVLFIAVTGGGGCNVLSDMSDRSSDQVIMDDARNLMDHGLWNDAVLKLSLLSPGGQQLRAAKVLLATAYAGRGGLNIVNLANKLNGASGNFFILLMKAFVGSKVSNFSDQVTAESNMLGISSAASGRTVDENLFMVFLEFAKLGTLFAAVADPDGDGLVDAAFDNCTAFSALQMQHIATAVGILVDSLGAVGNTIANSATTSLTGYCGSYAGVCASITASSVNAATQKIAATLAGESHYGIGLAVASSKDKCEFSAPNGNCEGGGALQTTCP